MLRALAVFTLLFLISTTTAIAQDYWWETTITENFDYNGGLQTVDFDMDGDPDVVAWKGHPYDYMVSWWENDGAAQFTFHGLFMEPDSLEQVRVIDFDDDGDMDIFALQAGRDIQWYENTGDLQFDVHTVHSGLIYKPTFKVLDFDSDGDFDIVASDRVDWTFDAEGLLLWIEWDGADQFTTHILVQGEPFSRVAAADLDNDGDTDLIAESQGPDDPWIYLLPYENSGDNTFTVQDTLGVYAPIQFVDCVDMDLDGDLDIVPSRMSAHQEYSLWMKNEGGFSFTRQQYPQLGISYSISCIADLDDDGDLDLLMRGGPITAYINNGSGGLTAEIISVLSSSGNSAVADLDGNGSFDVVHGNGYAGLVWSKRSDIPQPLPEGTLVNTVSNSGMYSDPNLYQPGGEFPGGRGKYYFWSGDFWVGAKLDDEYHVSHSDYGNYEFKPSAPMGGNRPEVELITIGDGRYRHDCSYDDFELVDGHTPLGLQVDQIVRAAQPGEGEQGGHLVLQTLTNASDSQLDSVFAGWKFDMDIASGPSGDPTSPHIDDMCSYLPDEQIAYMWDSDHPDSPWDDTGEFGWIPGYAGIKLLDGPTETAAFQWWAWTDDPGTDLEKYQFMAGIHPGSGGAYKAEPDTVWDYRVLITTGPFTLMPGESVDLAMTYAIGYDLDDLVDTINEMETFWLSAPETRHSSGQPLTFSLGAPYPNPFNASVMIPFQLDQRGHATIAVTDILGRRVATLINGVRQPGQYLVTFTGDNLASGVYFVSLSSGGRTTQAQKVVYMK